MEALEVVTLGVEAASAPEAGRARAAARSASRTAKLRRVARGARRDARVSWLITAIYPVGGLSLGKRREWHEHLGIGESLEGSVLGESEHVMACLAQLRGDAAGGEIRVEQQPQG